MQQISMQRFLTSFRLIHINFLLMIFLSGNPSFISAQSIDMGLFEGSTNTVEVRMKTDYTIPGNLTLSAAIVTLRWTDPTVSFTTNYIFPFFLAPQGGVQSSGDYYYQVFAAVPFQPLGSDFVSGTERLLMSVTLTNGLCATIEIAEDAFAIANNAIPYIEVQGANRTGGLYKPSLNLNSQPGTLSRDPLEGIVYSGQSIGNLSLNDPYGNVLQWQKQLNDGNWTDIAHTGSSYSEAATDYGVMSYRVEVQKPGCDVVYSNEVDVTLIGGNVWEGSISADWFDPFNWSKGVVPAEYLQAIIPSVATQYPIINPGAVANCYDLVFYLDAMLTISANAKLDVLNLLSGNTLTEDYQVFIQSNAAGTGSLIHQGNYGGVKAEVQRYLTGGWGTWDAGWHHISSPVFNQPIADFETTGVGNGYDFYGWDQESDTWINYKGGSFEAWNGGFEFNLGQSYLISYEQASVSQSFKGVLNVDDVIVTDLTFSPSQTHTGWHLLGNPFTSALQWNGADWNIPTSMAENAKIWNSQNKSYTDVLPGEVIPMAQGFTVAVDGFTESFTIPEKARLHDATPYFKSSVEKLLSITVYDENKHALQTVQVVKNPMSTMGYDFKTDAHFLPGYAPQLYFNVEQVLVSTNSIPHLSEELTFNLGFIKNQFDEFVMEFEYSEDIREIWLRDLKTQTEHPVKLNRYFTFSADEFDTPDRFELYFKSLGEPIAESTDLPSLYASKSSVYLNGFYGLTSIEVFDTGGKLVYTNQLQASGQNQLNLPLAPGLYLVNTRDKNHTVNEKIFIQP